MIFIDNVAFSCKDLLNDAYAVCELRKIIVANEILDNIHRLNHLS